MTESASLQQCSLLVN